MVLDESNKKAIGSNISLNEEQEREFISQIKPATLTMIASILSDMVYVEGGELILTNQNSQAFDLRREASEKLKEVRADLDTAAKMIQKSKQDLKKANRESIGLIKEKDIKKVDEKKLSAEKGLEQLSEIKRKSEEEIEYYSSIISQNSNSKKTVSGFWQMRNCVGANAMRVLGIEVDRYSNENDSYTYDDAELFVLVFTFGRCPEIGSLTFFPEIHLRFGSESAKLQGEIPVEVLAREHFDPVHLMSRFFKTLEKLGKLGCRGNMPSGRAKFIKGILAVKVAALLEGGVFLIVEKAAIFHVVTEVFCKPELISDTDEVVYFVVSVVNEF